VGVARKILDEVVNVADVRRFCGAAEFLEENKARHSEIGRCFSIA
jgi:hypothetical protein